MAKAFEMPYRPIYEWPAATFWFCAALLIGWLMMRTSLPQMPFRVAMVTAVGMGLLRVYSAWPLWRQSRQLRNHTVSYLEFEQLKAFVERTMKTDDPKVWIGWGGTWTRDATERTYEVIRRGPETMMKPEALSGGPHWLQAMPGPEHAIEVSLKALEGHLFISGATGTGKTRALDILITQAILRGDAVFIFDPKGDNDLRDKVQRCCEAIGAPERFVIFDPASPETTWHIDPLRNYNRPTELATRMAELLPSGGKDETFKAFAWKALNDVVQGLIMTGIRPNILNIGRFIQGNIGELLNGALRAYMSRVNPRWEVDAEAYFEKCGNNPAAKLNATIRYYREKVEPTHPSPAINGLTSNFEHNREHMSKLIASLQPVLAMLTAGHMCNMLSPTDKVAIETNRVTDSATIIRKGQVAYFDLDTLSDGIVGSALGSMYLSDLTAVAGERYNSGDMSRPVSVFIDEAAELINAPSVQLANKGRGAGMRLTMATQTIPDFVVRMGSDAAANKALGNLNNILTLRVLDDTTTTMLADQLPEYPIRKVQRSLRAGNDSEHPTGFQGGYSEDLSEEEVAMIPRHLFTQLPNFHYIARFTDGRYVKGRLPILKTPLRHDQKIQR